MTANSSVSSEEMYPNRLSFKCSFMPAPSGDGCVRTPSYVQKRAGTYRAQRLTAHRLHHAAPEHAPQTHQQHAREVGPAVQTPCRWPTNGL